MAVDPGFGLNNFGAPKIYNETETVARNVLMVLFGKPGSYPSLPHIGMDIPKLLLTSYDDLSEDALKQELVNQCSSFSSVVRSGEFDVIKTFNTDKDNVKKPLLLFKIPTQIKTKSRNLVIAIESGSKGITYNFVWID